MITKKMFENMIEMASKTGKSVIISYTPDKTNFHEEPPIIVPDTSLQSPGSSTGWRSRNTQIWSQPSRAPHSQQNTAAYPTSTSMEVQRLSHEEVKRLLAKIDGSNLPSDLMLNPNAEVFSALVEWEFSKLPHNPREQLVMGLARAVGRDWPLGRRGSSWNDKKCDSIISLASSILNRSPIEAALVVGYLLGLRSEYCFRTFPAGANAPLPLSTRVNSIQEHIPRRLIVKEHVYTLQDVDYVHDFSEVREQAVCRYVNENDDFFLLASRVELDGELALRIGAAPASAWLYSRTRIARHREASVLLCLDMRVASCFRNLAREAKVFSRTNIVVSGCFGGARALEALHFKDLVGHRVVIIPESSCEGLKNAEDWAKRCIKEGAASVGVYPWPLVAPGMPTLDKPYSSEQWATELRQKAIQLDAIELPSQLACKVRDAAISIKGYKEWMKSIGFKSVPAEKIREKSLDFHPVRLADIQEERGGARSLSWDSLIKPQYTTLIWGPTNVGKSFVAIQLCHALTAGLNAFGLSAVSCRQVLYLDGEAGAGAFKMRSKQLLQGAPDAQERVGQNLFVLPLSSWNILEEAAAQDIVEKLRNMKIHVLVIDNLLALAPSAAKSNADGLFKFVHEVEQAGVAVVIIHHAGKDGTNFKGPSDLASLSQNVIRLEGRDQLERQEDRSAEVDEACRAGGLVVRQFVEKCKALPQLEQTSATYHLPIDRVWRHIEGSLGSADQSSQPEVLDSELRIKECSITPTPDVDMGSLSPDEVKVLDTLKEQSSSRVELEKQTGLKKDKLGDILRKLTERGIVKKEGKGKATYYRCV